MWRWTWCGSSWGLEVGRSLPVGEPWRSGEPELSVERKGPHFPWAHPLRGEAWLGREWEPSSQDIRSASPCLGLHAGHSVFPSEKLWSQGFQRDHSRPTIHSNPSFLSLGFRCPLCSSLCTFLPLCISTPLSLSSTLRITPTETHQASVECGEYGKMGAWDAALAWGGSRKAIVRSKVSSKPECLHRILGWTEEIFVTSADSFGAEPTQVYLKCHHFNRRDTLVPIK